MIDNEILHGYIINKKIIEPKPKKAKYKKNKETGEKELVKPAEEPVIKFVLRIKLDNYKAILEITSIKDKPEYVMGRNFNFEIQGEVITNHEKPGDYFMFQVNGMKEINSKETTNTRYSANLYESSNKEITTGLFSFQLNDCNKLLYKKGIWGRLEILDTIREVIKNNIEDPKQKKLEQFVPKDDTKVTLSFEENGKKTEVTTDLETMEKAKNNLEKAIKKNEEITPEDQESINMATGEDSKKSNKKKLYQH